MFVKHKVGYINNNPVKFGVFEKPENYIYSDKRNYANEVGNIGDESPIRYVYKNYTLLVENYILFSAKFGNFAQQILIETYSDELINQKLDKSKNILYLHSPHFIEIIFI